MEYDDCSIKPFDPEAGLRFKVGHIYAKRDEEIAAFEMEVGTKLPSDFLEMIGEYCEGSPDGAYRVYSQTERISFGTSCC